MTVTQKKMNDTLQVHQIADVSDSINVTMSLDMLSLMAQGSIEIPHITGCGYIIL